MKRYQSKRIPREWEIFTRSTDRVILDLADWPSGAREGDERLTATIHLDRSEVDVEVVYTRTSESGATVSTIIDWADGWDDLEWVLTFLAEAEPDDVREWRWDWEMMTARVEAASRVKRKGKVKERPEGLF